MTFLKLLELDRGELINHIQDLQKDNRLLESKLENLEKENEKHMKAKAKLYDVIQDQKEIIVDLQKK